MEDKLDYKKAFEELQKDLDKERFEGMRVLYNFLKEEGYCDGSSALDDDILKFIKTSHKDNSAKEEK